ncbi:9805_t:CDS:2 [Paraglomus brasilianum]|uniref:9805_t:CDS:1 n=1 Tax=Paraglomus brasilianum TaxID=144538 RepID=A0A9N9BYY0_9GLOM|nr:9805_t:CDS:2 [Paraglomus brasilianum]
MASEEDLLKILSRVQAYHGLIIGEDGAQPAPKRAVALRGRVSSDFSRREPIVYLIHSRRASDTFLYENHIKPADDLLCEPLGLFINSNKQNPYFNPRPDNTIIFQVFAGQCIMHFEDYEPTKEFVEAITKAIDSGTPYKALDDVFAEYGYWWNRRIRLGGKLQRATKLTMNPNPAADNQIISDYDNDYTFDSIYQKWSDIIQPAKSDHLVSGNGDVIRIESIPNWQQLVQVDQHQWTIIDRSDFIPTYELLDNSLRMRLASLYPTIRNLVTGTYVPDIRILLTGKSIIDPWSKDICRVKFPAPFNNTSYHVYGALYEKEKRRDDVEIRLSSANTCEIAFEIDWTEYPVSTIDIHIQWIIFGNPVEVGYFSPKNRDVIIERGMVKELGVEAIKLYRQVLQEHSLLLMLDTQTAIDRVETRVKTILARYLFGQQV